MIDRRSFILKSIVGLVGTQIPINPINTPLWNPHPAQLRFFSQSEIPLALYGIPYHQSNASSGQWLGIMRAAYNDIHS